MLETVNAPYRLLENEDVGRDDFAQAVREGLTRSRKQLPCRFLYDTRGSSLFDALCATADYYLTRTELAILAEHASEIADRLPGNRVFELGSGNALKTRVLLAEFLKRHRTVEYLAVDISRSALVTSAEGLLRDHPALQFVGIVAEYEQGIELLGRDSRAKIVLWLGSNVGNLGRHDACAFLRRIRSALKPEDRFLVGADLRKDPEILRRAYDDAAGVTARFNLNLLERINRELRGHFELARFRHTVRYNRQLGRIEMYLESRSEQRVPIDALDLSVYFGAGERIHTENSYKYSLPEIVRLAHAAGFAVEKQWVDPAAWFSVNLLSPQAA